MSLNIRHAKLDAFELHVQCIQVKSLLMHCILAENSNAISSFFIIQLYMLHSGSGGGQTDIFDIPLELAPHFHYFYVFLSLSIIKHSPYLQ